MDSNTVPTSPTFALKKAAFSPQPASNARAPFLQTIPSAKVDENDAEFYHLRGFAHRKNGNYYAAISDYTKAIELNPKHFKAYFNRGFSYDKLGQYEQAIENYTKALEIDPSNAYTYYNRGISYDRLNNFEAAIVNFTKAIEIDPSNADFYHNRGFSYRKLGNYKQAISDYTKALGLDSEHFKAYYNRAFSYDKIGEFVKSVEDYTSAIHINPKNANAYHNRFVTLIILLKTHLHSTKEDHHMRNWKNWIMLSKILLQRFIWTQLMLLHSIVEVFAMIRWINLQKLFQIFLLPFPSTLPIQFSSKIEV